MYLVGKIVKTHGIRGEVLIKSETNFPRFEKGSKLFLDDGSTVEICFSKNYKGLVLAKLDAIDSIGDAEKYMGKALYIYHDRSELKEGEYYYEDLIGCVCLNKNKEEIGSVSDLIEVPKGVILEVKNKKKTILIPYVKSFITKVDLEDKIIYVNEIEGLL